MNTQNFLLAYIIYLPVALLLTIFVTRKLFGNSMVYMLDIFHGRQEIAKATNELFKIGFYLLNMGFALLILKIGGQLLDAKNIFEVLSTKIGGFSIYLGVMLLLNLLFFFRGKKAAAKHVNG
ncbi:MAG TPA: hypothetical protein VL053_18515 [Arachidicoccus sp.]|nr:hypothetical protein [Arachidicoccus sp.]